MMMVLVQQLKTEPQYGWHDRFRIPLGHPSALRFYVEHLVIPNSFSEMLWVNIARRSPDIALEALSRRPLSERLAVTEETQALGDLLEEQLQNTGRPLQGPLYVLTVDDYRGDLRGQTVLFLFEEDAPLPCAVAKVAVPAHQQKILENEYRTLQTLGHRVGASIRSTIPKPLAFVRKAEFGALLERFIPGRSMFFEVRNRWQPQVPAAQHFRHAGFWLAQFHGYTVSDRPPLKAHAAAIASTLTEFQRVCTLSRAERDLIDSVCKAARNCEHRVPIVAGHGDYRARNLLISEDKAYVVDWQAFDPHVFPFDDLFMFPTTYGLTYPWKVAAWAAPRAAFHATYLQENALAGIVRDYLQQYCVEMGIDSEILQIMFPVFLANRALQERAWSDGHVDPEQTWRALFHAYAHRVEPACFEE